MKPERLVKALSTGILDLRPAELAMAIKAKNHEYRRRKKDEKKVRKEMVHEAKRDYLAHGHAEDD